MAYVINFSKTTLGKLSFAIDNRIVEGPTSPNDSTPITSPDLSTATPHTSLILYGRGSPNYGERLQENLVYLLENFWSDLPPVIPTDGQIWYDSTAQRLKAYNGTNWFDINAVFADAVAPGDTTYYGATADEVDHVGETEGHLWFDTANQQLMIYDGTQWISIADQYVAKAGSIMDPGADITFSAGGEIYGLPDLPTQQDAAASKEYVDDEVGAAVLAAAGALGTHETNGLHLTAYQNTMLDDIESLYSGLEAVELGYMDGVTSNVQVQLDGKLNIDGTNVMAGTLDLNSNRLANIAAPTFGTDAMSRDYADARYVELGGDTMTGVLNMGLNTIDNVADGVSGAQAVNRSQLDSFATDAEELAVAMAIALG